MPESAPRFPFRRRVCLDPLVAFWRQCGVRPGPRGAYARTLLEQYEATPDLHGPIDDVSILDGHRDIVEALLTAALPVSAFDVSAPGGDGSPERAERDPGGRGHDAVLAVMPPFGDRLLHATPAFRALWPNGLETLDAGTNVLRASREEALISIGKSVHAYGQVLARYYGVEDEPLYPLIVPVRSHNGLVRYFKLQYDTRWVDVVATGTPPELGADAIARMRSEPMNLALWQELLPPDAFEFHGVVLLHAIEVTIQEALSRLKDDLLQPHALASRELFDGLQAHIRSLMGRPELQLGLIHLDPAEADEMPEVRPVVRSLLASEGQVPYCPRESQSLYALACSQREPIVVPDLETQDVCTGFESHLRALGLRNLLIAPLFYNDRLVGLLELASPNAGDINALNAMTLMEVVTLFGTAVQRTAEEREDRLQAIIKEKCTAIHPVVEWRFQEAARDFMERRDTDPAAQIGDIVFSGVYPLYGLSDVRNSSVHRNEAIREDLESQLGLALAAVVEANMHSGLPILDELGYRIERYIDRITPSLASGDEVEVLDFLRADVEPIFQRLKAADASVARRIDDYQQALHPRLGIVYKQRDAFEASISHVNGDIGAFLQQSDTRAQAWMPHYFEMFKTDGVDYNIYIGSSLLRRARFDPLYLRNLRLWQLITTCGVSWLVDALRSELAMPLEVAHLVLVQSAPLSIRFRYDEKKFDVDGAYNIRYEIVKKRIDKAVVRASGERLTQPGHLAVVYAQQREAREYQGYFDYLRAAGYVEGEIEDLALEDLPGAPGLRALRVRVAEHAPDAEVQVHDAITQLAD